MSHVMSVWVAAGILANSTAEMLFAVGCDYGAEWAMVAYDTAIQVMALEG